MRADRVRLVMVMVLLMAGAHQVMLGGARAADSGNTYYVSRDGNNRDGESWATAWNELDQIEWSVLRPGDTLWLDGGAVGMVYETSLKFAKSGEAERPIVIKASAEEGHSGQITFFGGRQALLPYCGQAIYENQPEGTVVPYAIETEDYDYILLDGGRWQGIKIHGYGSGIRIDAGSRDLTFRYVEVFNNGTAEYGPNGWESDQCGVCLGGKNITLQRVIIHDNGQDAIQSLSGANNIHNFRLEQSWLYNGRTHPTVYEAANYCTHTDGIQIFDGGVVSGITVTESIIGPGFTNGVLLGQIPTETGAWASVDEVTFRDVLFTKAADNNAISYRGTSPHNWALERVTLHCPNTKQQCLRIFSADHAVTDSIVVDGQISFPDGLNTYSGNCIWNTAGFRLGAVVNPGFASVSETDFFSLDDYTVTLDLGCIGSQITSVAQLLALK